MGSELIENLITKYSNNIKSNSEILIEKCDNKHFDDIEEILGVIDYLNDKIHKLIVLNDNLSDKFSDMTVPEICRKILGYVCYINLSGIVRINYRRLENYHLDNERYYDLLLANSLHKDLEKHKKGEKFRFDEVEDTIVSTFMLVGDLEALEDLITELFECASEFFEYDSERFDIFCVVRDIILKFNDIISKDIHHDFRLPSIYSIYLKDDNGDPIKFEFPK